MRIAFSCGRNSFSEPSGCGNAFRPSKQAIAYWVV